MCQLYCLQSTLSKVTDIFVDKFESKSHYFPSYGLTGFTGFIHYTVGHYGHMYTKLHTCKIADIS